MKYYIILFILWVYSDFSFVSAQKNNNLTSDIEISETMAEIDSIVLAYIDTENDIACNIIEGRLKQFYIKQNKSTQDSIIGRLYQNVKSLIASENINAVKKISYLFRSIAPANDKRVYLSFFEEANLAESKMDSIYLNQIINGLTNYSDLNKLNIQEDLNLLNKKLQSIRNTKGFTGIWISDKQLTIKDPFPDYIIHVTQDNTQKLHISTNLCYNIQKRLFKKGLFSDFSNYIESNLIIEVSENNLYSNWSSEKLTIGNAELSTSLRKTTRDINASIVGHFSRKNEHSMSEQMAADIVTEIGSTFVNKLFDNIAVSKKKIYIYEQSMTLTQPNIMSVDIKGQRIQKKSSNLNTVDKYEYKENVKFLRLDNESNMPFTENQLFMSKKKIKELGIYDEEFNNICRLSRNLRSWSTVVGCITGAGIGLGLGSFAFKPSDDGMGFKGYKTMAFTSLGIAAAGLATSLIVFPNIAKKLNKKILKYNEKKMQSIRNNAELSIELSSENLGISLKF